MKTIYIPTNWQQKRLSAVSKKQISYGIVQTGENIKDGIPCVRVIDLTVNDIDVTQMIKTTDKINLSYKKTILEEGEIMLALRGVIGLVKLVNKQLIGCNVTRGIARISPNKKIVTSEFLFWIIQSSLSRKDLLRRVNGSALKEIPINELRKTFVLLPPLEEQKKIAEILSTWDNAIAITEKLIAAKQKLKKGLRQKLFNLPDGKKKEFTEFTELVKA